MLGECREKESKLGSQARKRKFIRGKREGDAHKENQHPPFLTGFFLYPTNENFSEGMVT